MIIIMAGMLKFEAIQYPQKKTYDPKKGGTRNLIPVTCNL